MRPTNDEYFLTIALVVSSRATCARRRVGCVLVDENNFIVATAYNSVPRDMVHCTDVPCAGADHPPGKGLHLCIAQHAETLALIRCRDIYDIHTCYVTASPCIDCTRRLLDTSCQRIVFAELYPHKEAGDLWKRNGRRWERYCHELPSTVHTGVSMDRAKRATQTRVRKALGR